MAEGNCVRIISEYKRKTKNNNPCMNRPLERICYVKVGKRMDCGIVGW